MMIDTHARATHAHARNNLIEQLETCICFIGLFNMNKCDCYIIDNPSRLIAVPHAFIAKFTNIIIIMVINI